MEVDKEDRENRVPEEQGGSKSKTKLKVNIRCALASSAPLVHIYEYGLCNVQCGCSFRLDHEPTIPYLA